MAIYISHNPFMYICIMPFITCYNLFQAIEIVEERSTKKPFDPKHKLYASIKSLAMDNGLICYPSGGTVDGVSGDHVLLAPPFIVSPDQLDEMVEKLGIAVDSALGEAGVT